MKSVNVYLNFAGNTEVAFNFYKSIFGGDFMGGIMRFRDLPPMGGDEGPPVPDDEMDLVAHVALPLTDHATLMGTDITSNAPQGLVVGNNVQITLEPKNVLEAESLFKRLSSKGEILMPLQEMFWAERYGACIDRFGVHWQINYAGNKNPYQG